MDPFIEHKSVSSTEKTFIEEIDISSSEQSLSNYGATLQEGELIGVNTVYSKGLQLGDYKLIKKLGEGSFGSVWKAKNKKNQNTCALKILNQDLNLQEQLSEPEVMSRLNHPHIVGVHEAVFLEGGALGISMEFIQGVSLGKYLKQKIITFSEIHKITTQISDALVHAHSMGVAHRDLKLDNILMSSDNNEERDTVLVKVVDFGVSRIVGTYQLNPDVSGTYFFMSPEQLRGRISQESDVWALGVICYIMLCGHAPFRAQDTLSLMRKIGLDRHSWPDQVATSTPKNFLDLVDKMLEKDFRHRVSASDVFTELNRLNGKAKLRKKNQDVKTRDETEKACFIKAVAIFRFGFACNAISRSATVILLVISGLLLMISWAITIVPFIYALFCAGIATILHLIIKKLNVLQLRKYLRFNLLPDQELADCYRYIFNLEHQNRLNLSRYASFLLSLEKYDEIEQVCLRALKSDPYDSQSMVLMAQVCLCREQYNNTKSWCERLLTADPHNVEAKYMNGLSSNR